MFEILEPVSTHPFHLAHLIIIYFCFNSVGSSPHILIPPVTNSLASHYLVPVLLWWAPDFSPCWPQSPLAPTRPSHIIVIKLFLTLQCSAPPLGESMSLQRSFWDPYPRLWAFQGDPYLPGLLKLQSKFSHSLSNPSRLSHLCAQAHVWLFNMSLTSLDLECSPPICHSQAHHLSSNSSPWNP